MRHALHKKNKGVFVPLQEEPLTQHKTPHKPDDDDVTNSGFVNTRMQLLQVSLT